MNTDKHRSKKAAAQDSSRTIQSEVLAEPKLSKEERVAVERAWKIEIRRRLADVESGKLKCIPAEEVIRNASRQLERVAHAKL